MSAQTEDDARPGKTPPQRRRNPEEPPAYTTDPEGLTDAQQPRPSDAPATNGALEHQRAPRGFETPPHNLDLELLIVGALMADRTVLEPVRDCLRPEHFYESHLAGYYAEIRARIIDGRVANFQALSAGKDTSERDRIYRIAMTGAGNSADDVASAANEIIALWQRRQQIELADTLRNASFDLSVSATEWRAKAVAQLAAIESENPQRVPPNHIDLSRLAQPLPDRRFLVSDWIPTGHVTSIYGEGSSGKSFLAMILASCMSAGIPWLGTPVTKCRVLGFFCEDNDEELLLRQSKILRGLSLTWLDVAENLFICDRVGSQNAIMTFDQGRPISGPAMQDIMAKIDQVKPRLLILDNIAHLYGGNENDRFQVTTFLNHLAGIARAIDGSVVLLGHPPKNEAQYSGSTAWSNNVRSRLWLEKCKDDEERWILRRAKTNYADPCDLNLLRDPITGLVRPDDPAYETEASRHEAERKLGAARQHLKDAIDTLNARDINTAPTKQARNHLLKVLESEEMTGGFKRRVLERALQSLLTTMEVDYLIIGQHAKGKPKKSLVRTSTLA